MTSEEVSAIVRGVVRAVRRRVPKTLEGVTTQVALLEAQMTHMAEALKGFSGVQERVVVLETRAPVQGPPGPPGRDGIDGLGFDDLDLIIDEARKGCFLRFMRGDQVKEFRLPTPFDVGPYHDGERYEKGNGVSWSGSWWIAKTQTTDKPGDGATAWRLSVKKGRDAKDGKDGPPGPPGPPGDDWQQVYDKRRR